MIARKIPQDVELLIYGLAKGETERYTEELLSTRCRTQKDVDALIERASKDGWHSFRLATYDGSPPDFVGAISKKATG